jgi:hypothetical protein
VRLPARITGAYQSGKTTLLRELAAEYERPLVICATVAAAEAFGFGATTWWGVACDVLGQPPPPPTAHDDLAVAVCHYQASFLGIEELRTHADAAGVLDQWEHVAQEAEQSGPTWASVLVEASLQLRDQEVWDSVRSRFDAVLVDDFESASFATNRLLSQLAGFGGPVIVAGNPDNAVWRHVMGAPSYLVNFPRRYGAVEDVHLDTRYDAIGHGEVELVIEPGGDPWLPLPDGPVPVALASSLSWSTVRITAGPEPAPSPYDLDVLGGPDVPSAAERAERVRREDAARWALARSRGGVG